MCKFECPNCGEDINLEIEKINITSPSAWFITIMLSAKNWSREINAIFKGK